MTTSEKIVKLQCLNGQPAPPAVMDGCREWLQLPDEAVKTFWDVLRPVLRNPAHPNNSSLFKAFCEKFNISEADLIKAVYCMDLLLRQAAAMNLDKENFGRDLAGLSGGQSANADIILQQYDNEKNELRKILIHETLADHGKVMVGLGWRLDRVKASSRGVNLDTEVVHLSLKYRDGDRIKRINLQLTPEATRDLKRFSDRFSV